MRILLYNQPLASSSGFPLGADIRCGTCQVFVEMLIQQFGSKNHGHLLRFQPGDGIAYGSERGWEWMANGQSATVFSGQFDQAPDLAAAVRIILFVVEKYVANESFDLHLPGQTVADGFGTGFGIDEKQSCLFDLVQNLSHRIWAGSDQ